MTINHIGATYAYGLAASVTALSGSTLFYYATDTDVLYSWNGSAYVPIEFWNAGTVTAIGTGLTVNAGHSLVADWGAGVVTSLAPGLIVSGGTLIPFWQNTAGGAVTGVGNGIFIFGNVLSSFWQYTATAITALGAGISVVSNALVNTGVLSVVAGSNMSVTSGNTVAVVSSPSFSGSVTATGGVVSLGTTAAAGINGSVTTNSNAGGAIASGTFTTLITLVLGRGNWMAFYSVACTAPGGDVLDATIGLLQNTVGSSSYEQGMQAQTVVNGANIVNPCGYFPDVGSSQTLQARVFAVSGSGGNPTVGASVIVAVRIA